MRVHIEFLAKNPLSLPLHHAADLQGLIYHSISDSKMASQLHDQGLRRVGSKPIKLFTFSRLMGRYQIDLDKKTITFLPGTIRWAVSSAIDELVYNLGLSFLKAQTISIHGVTLEVGAVRTERFAGTTTQAQVRLLSPVTVYRTVNRPSGRFTEYYRPGTSEFSELILQNIFLKAQALGEEIPKDEATFELIPVAEETLRERIVFVKSTPVHAWEGDFIVKSGSMKLMEIAWDTGLGGKNSSGFGLFNYFFYGR